MDFSDEVPGFLMESNENLALLDLELVKLEKNPDDEALIASVFRIVHTVKGTAGFFGFSILGSITHLAENILGQVREKQRRLTPGLVSLIMETVDAVRAVLRSIESSGGEGHDQYQQLRDRLEAAFLSVGETADRGLAPTQAAMTTVHRRRHSDEAEAAPQQYNRRADDVAPSLSAIRVDVRMLDKLMNLVGELVLAHNQMLKGEHQSTAQSTNALRLNRIISQLQEAVMRTRMQPIGGLWKMLPRVVRDLASELGKRIDLEMVGAETELDKTIMEAIKDPLTHLVRNSCDHGIEKPEDRLAVGKNAVGTIVLRAFHESGHVNLEMSDDGIGMDPERVKSKAVQKGLIRAEHAALLSDREALRLVFVPGFSTAETVTGVSGRGVGMDVVKTNIEKIGGTVDLENQPGRGTTIKIKLPLTLAIIPGLIVTVRGKLDSVGTPQDQTFVIPQGNVLELIRLEGAKGHAQMDRMGEADVLRRRGKLLPIVYLSELLSITSRRHGDDVTTIVVVKADDTPFGLVVDEVHDTQDIVVKALGKLLKPLIFYVGATILGDGKLALIFDVMGLARLAKVISPSLERVKLDAASQVRLSDVRQLLLFRSGIFPRLALDLPVVARLEEIARSRIEYAAGKPVVRYRETLLPLVWLKDLLEADPNVSDSVPASLQVIVVAGGSGHTGLVVDEILDIVDDLATCKQASSRFGLITSGIVGEKLVDFVDLDALLTAGRKRSTAHQPLDDELDKTPRPPAPNGSQQRRGRRQLERQFQTAALQSFEGELVESAP